MHNVKASTRNYLVLVVTAATLCSTAFAQDWKPSFGIDTPVLIASTTEASALRTQPPNASASIDESSSDSLLPDAPSSMLPDAAPAMFSQGAPVSGTAPKHDKYIPAGWTAQPLTAGDKIIVGAKDLYSLENFAAIIASAGYSHVSDGQPNYGVNSEAFAKRVGAAAVRETSQGIFTDMIFSPLLHQDPRYYAKGPQYGFFNRSIYAITRPIIGRTDGGHGTINAALLLGYAGAAALTPTYYPDINHNFRDVASTYGGSLGGAAIGFFLSEFSDQVLQAIHLKK